MFERNQTIVPGKLFDELGNKDGAPEAIDELKSSVIVAYEHALELGISPSAAIGAVLDLLSLEFQRYAGVYHADE